MFFTAVNPVRANQHKEVDFDLTKPRIAVYKNTWKIHQNTVYQTRSNAIVFYITLPAICIEKSGIHEVKEKNCTIVYQSPRLPRKAVLTPNLHHGRQDLSNLESRTSTDHRSKESEEPKIQSVQPRVEGFDPQDGKNRVLRAMRDQFQHTMPRMFTILGKKALYAVRAANACIVRKEIYS